MKKNLLGKTVANVALSMGKKATNSACYPWFNQPKEPKAMAQFKK